MIRAAEPRDAHDLGLLRRRAVRVAYDGFVDPEKLEEQEDLGVWEQRIDEAPEGTLWVWEQDGRVVGFVSGLPEAENQPGVGLIQGLFVDPVAQGAGVGRALYEKAVESIKAGGATAATLWVLADNRRARRFFEGLGWAKEPGVQDNDPNFGVLVYRYRNGSL